jgi:hypothetical protein
MALLTHRFTRVPSVRHLPAVGLALSLILSIGIGPNLAAANPVHGEYEVKAAFLLNFARLVEWPAASFASPHAPLVLAVFADDEVDDSIERGVRGKTVGSHPVQVVRIARGEDVAGSHIVFVSSGDRDRNRRVIKAALGKSVLTVGDANDFVQDGGIINFFIKDQKIRFAINRQAAENAGLRISSRLLRLARVVASEGSGP